MDPTQQDGASSKPQRPSLMGSSGSSATPIAGHRQPTVRLLDAIERETTGRAPAGRRSTLGVWWWGGGSALLALSGVLWFSAGSSTGPVDTTVATNATPATLPPAAASAAASQAAETMAVVAPSPTASATSDALLTANAATPPASAANEGTAPEPLASTPQVALATQPTNAAPRSAAAALAGDSLAERQPSGAAPGTAQGKAPNKVPTAKDARKPKSPASSERAVASAGTAKDKTREAAAGKARPTATASAGKGGAQRGHEPDADADVVAAIMASLDRRGPAPLSAIPTAPNNAAARSTASSNIAERVSRCNSLPDQEMLACRRSVCEGHWGKAPACPVAPSSQASAHP